MIPIVIQDYLAQRLQNQRGKGACYQDDGLPTWLLLSNRWWLLWLLVVIKWFVTIRLRMQNN